MKKFVSVLVLAAVMMLPLSASAGLLKPGMPYVPFELPTDGGETVKSEDVVGKGKVVILTFMNTVCSTCAAELTDLTKMAKENKDLVIFPIAVDMRGEKSIPAYKKNMNYEHFDFLLDPKFALGRKYGATYTPFTIVIGKDGTVAEIVGGYDEGKLKQIVDAIHK